jgi:hypothetical protein
MGDAMNQTEKTDSQTTHYIRRMHRWRMAFFGLVILLAGIVIGAASIMIVAPHKLSGPLGPREIAIERLLAELQRYLHLTPEQREKIEPILKEDMQKLDDIRADARSEIQDILGQMNRDIAAVLTEQQKQIWQQRLNHLQRQLRPPGRGPGEGGRYRGGPQARKRRGPGPFGPRRHPAGPNMPYNGMHQRKMWEHRKDPNEPINEL